MNSHSELPGSRVQKATQALDDAKAKFSEVEARYKAGWESHNQQEAEARANPELQTEKEKKRRDQAWNEELTKMNIAYRASDAAVHVAFQAVAAAKANEIAQTCKSGKNLLKCQVGEIVLQKALMQYYGNDCSTVLGGHVKRGCGNEDVTDLMDCVGYSGPILLTVTKPLPTKGDYQKVQQEYYTRPLSELIHRAYQLIEEHRSDLQYKQDNASEAAQEGDAYQSRDEQIYELEGVDEPDVPESVAGTMIYHVPKHGTLSEAARLLEHCLQALKAKGEAAVADDDLKGFADFLEETLGLLESI